MKFRFAEKSDIEILATYDKYIRITELESAVSLGEIGDYIGLPLFGAFVQYMDTEYKAIRKIEYSKDVWASGWNVKFKKAGKSLCVVYSKNGYYTVMIPLNHTPDFIHSLISL